jgi:hypothetical protein
MGYEQYSQFAYTGNVEAAKNRIANNSSDGIHSETVGFPNTFDIFVQKENASVGGFAVTEEHATADLNGTKLYLDHRLFADSTGGVGSITVSDGTIDPGTIDVFASSVEFTTLPTNTTFTATYTARSDKVQDSHLNSLQNAVMRMQTSLGLKNAVGGIGTGIATLPLVTTFDPANQSVLDALKQDIIPNIIMLQHLESNIKIGSTTNTNLDSFGGDGYTVQVGNPGAGSADNIKVSSNLLEVNDTREGTLKYSMNTGDVVSFSGCTLFASQVTMGEAHAGQGVYQGSVPTSVTGFYSEAMLRVNGGIYFGNGMSGVGNIVFVTATGQKVDIVGNLEATDLHVENTSLFDGVSTFKAKASALYPGYYETNANIVLTDRASVPTRIDGLDPSYARVAIESDAQVPGVVSTYVRKGTDLSTDFQPYISGSKQHPVHKFEMYPIIGGWMFTGAVSFAKAGFFSHKDVLLLQGDLKDVSSFGNGYGSYAPGLFSPSDTHIELDDGGDAKVSYPIYFHDVEIGGGGIATGINVYINADDNIMVSPSIIGADYRLFQPSNAPVDHLRSSGFPTTPAVEFGVSSSSYYANSSTNTAEFKTHAAFVGPSVGSEPFPTYKRLENNDTVSENILEALQRSIDHEQIVGEGGYAANTTGNVFGIAYVYAGTDSRDGTKHDQVKLKASPSPWGIAKANIWGSAGLNMNPGQWAIVGEVVAYTTNGTSWTEVETVGYRPNGLYDSCWVPLVNYRDPNLTAPLDSIPDDLGRCLPLFGTNDDASGPGGLFSTNEGDLNFWVEHNIGPVASLSEVSVRVFTASFPAGGYNVPSDGGWGSIHRMAGAGSANLWSPWAMPYNANHKDVRGGGAAGAGFFREITQDCDIRMFDSRFARLSFVDDTPFDEPGGDVAEYIRVVIKKTR